ncbi:hypothetical protein ACFOHS_16350 [Jhaorihella thermophila]
MYGQRPVALTAIDGGYATLACAAMGGSCWHCSDRRRCDRKKTGKAPAVAGTFPHPACPHTTRVKKSQVPAVLAVSH